MAMNPTTALPAVGSHHHTHHLHEGAHHGLGPHGHHTGPHHPHHTGSEVSFEEFTNSMSPFLDYSTSLHLTAGSPYAAVAAAAVASGTL